MVTHSRTAADLEFRRAFEAGEILPGEFNHLAHLRLAYVCLVEGGPDSAQRQMRRSLLAFLDAHHIPREKFHETLTRAWVMAVAHFMNRAHSASFAEFAANSSPLLNSQVMLTHYSHEKLFSASARAAFVAPDLEAIPL